VSTVWLHERCKQLNHVRGAIDAIITEMKNSLNANDSFWIRLINLVCRLCLSTSYKISTRQIYRPRLSTTAYSPETDFVGNIDFYDNYELIETYSIKELHALGVTLSRKPYGVDLLYAGKAFIVSSWKLPVKPVPASPQVIAASDIPQGHQSEALTDAL